MQHVTSQLPADRPVTRSVVTDRVTAFLGPVTEGKQLANSTVVVGADTTMIADTMVSTEMLAPVVTAAEELGGRPVGLVFNTHGDKDHRGGNDAFPEARVLAHRSVADNGATTVHEPFDEAWDGDLGGIPLHLTYVGPAHSEGDSFAWLPTEGVVIAGDVVFNGLFPLIRDDLDRWMNALDRIRQLEPTAVVPGHGPVGDAGIVAAQLAILEEVYEAVRSRYSAGMPTEEAVEEGPTPSLARLPLSVARWPGAVKGVYRVLDTYSGAG